MIEIYNKFRNLVNNLEITDLQREDAETKANNVCKVLHKYYYGSEYNGSTKLIIGSLGKNTAIRPPSDVDVIFELPFAEKIRYDNYKYNGQSSLLQDVKNILEKTYSSTYIHGDGPVVVIEFDSYKVELNPSIKTSEGYFVPITKDDGKWQLINPMAEKKELDMWDLITRGNVKNLIKIVKRWKYYNNVPIKSLALELLVTNFLSTYKYKNESFIYYDWMLRDFFKFLLSCKNKKIKLPNSYNTIELGSQWEYKAKIAYQCAIDAIKYDKDGKKNLAIYEWKKLFGYYFY